MKCVGFIGAGNMAYAMAGRLIASPSYSPSNVWACDLSQERRDLFASEGMRVTGDAAEVVGACDVVFLAVKPQHLAPVMTDLKAKHDAATLNRVVFVSIAAGVPLEVFLRFLPRCVRLMPNTPALVGQMYGGFSFSSGFTKEEEAQVTQMLDVMGRVHRVPEHLLDAVTAVSGSGPGFYAAIAAAFVKKGVAAGLSPEVALDLAVGTMLGTGTLLRDKGYSPKQLMTMVASKGGTTQAGLDALAKNGMDDTIAACFDATTKRSGELAADAARKMRPKL